MSKRTKIWLITASALVALGLIVFTVAMTVNHWNFKNFGNVKYETETFEIEEEFHSISMDTETADILFLRSEDGKCRVVCFEPEDATNSVAVQDGTLKITETYEKGWRGLIGFSTQTPKITVYLPSAEYRTLRIAEHTGNIEIPKDFCFNDMDLSASTGNVKNAASVTGLIKIATSTGNIRLENLSAGALELSASTGTIIAEAVTCEGDTTIHVSTGNVKLTGVTCKSLLSGGSTGNMGMTNVLVAEALRIERSTGNVSFDGCDAGEISVKTSTGSVKGSLRSEKIFLTKSNTGEIRVPATATGGRCEITTTTGSIEIEIK